MSHRARRLALHAAVAALLAVAPAGCDDVPSLAWNVHFASPSTGADAVAVETTISRGTCSSPGELIYTSTVTHSQRQAAIPPTLAEGTYAFAARSSDHQCRATAAGCTDVAVGSAPILSVEIVMRDTATIEPACSAVLCAAVRREAGEADAGPEPACNTRAATSISAGTAHTCIVSDDGRIFCWGADESGQLGRHRDCLDAVRAITTDTSEVGAVTWRAVTVGAAHTCAVTVSGAVWCWGSDEHAQLMPDLAAGRGTPRPAQAADMVNDPLPIAAGYFHQCVVHGAAASLACWGANESGQLGFGDTTAEHAGDVPGVTGVSLVAAGRAHTCVAISGGATRCFGAAERGRLGNAGATTGTPVNVSLAAPPTSLTAGDAHTCALTGAAELYCWGANESGQLGVGDTTDRAEPTRVPAPGPAWASVSAGGRHTCATDAAGALWCWGLDEDGQLGRGTAGGQTSAPIRAGDPADAWATVSAGAAHTCAIHASDRIPYCWGRNSRGKLGIGSTEARRGAPTQVCF